MLLHDFVLVRMSYFKGFVDVKTHLNRINIVADLDVTSIVIFL